MISESKEVSSKPQSAGLRLVLPLDLLSVVGSVVAEGKCCRAVDGAFVVGMVI